jgi:hypothetical protein
MNDIEHSPPPTRLLWRDVLMTKDSRTALEDGIFALESRGRDATAKRLLAHMNRHQQLTDAIIKAGLLNNPIT